VVLLYRRLLFSIFDPDVAGVSGVNVGLMEAVLMAMLSATILVTVRVVGVLLISAMLVLPAATARLLTDSFGRMLVLSPVLGAAIGVVGMYASGRGGSTAEACRGPLSWLVAGAGSSPADWLSKAAAAPALKSAWTALATAESPHIAIGPLPAGPHGAVPPQRPAVEQIAAFLEVDSLAYLSLDGLLRCMRESREHYCTACWSGDYRLDPEHPEAEMVVDSEQMKIFI
jgi:hypothetical protein